MELEPILPEDDFYERGRKTAANLRIHAQSLGLQGPAMAVPGAAQQMGLRMGVNVAPPTPMPAPRELEENEEKFSTGGVRG